MIAVLAAGLAGCAGLAPIGEAEEIAALLVRYQGVANRPAGELAAAVTDAHSAFERKPGEAERLWLALLLATPVLKGDEAKIMNVLAPLQAPGAEPASPRRALARVLFASAAERLRLRDEVQTRCQAMAQEKLERQEKAAAQRQRQDEIALREQLRRMGLAVQAEAQRCEVLQKKLDALRSIDRVAPKRGRPGTPTP